MTSQSALACARRSANCPNIHLASRHRCRVRWLALIGGVVGPKIVLLFLSGHELQLALDMAFPAITPYTHAGPCVGSLCFRVVRAWLSMWHIDWLELLGHIAPYTDATALWAVAFSTDLAGRCDTLHSLLLYCFSRDERHSAPRSDTGTGVSSWVCLCILRRFPTKFLPK